VRTSPRGVRMMPARAFPSVASTVNSNLSPILPSIAPFSAPVIPAIPEGTAGRIRVSLHWTLPPPFLICSLDYGSDGMSAEHQDLIEGAPLIRPSTTDHPLYDSVVEACRTVFDPEIPVNIFDLGLVYTIDISDAGEVVIVMTLTAPGCPVAGEMPGWVADAVEPLPGVKQVNVELTWDPPWGMDMMSDEARLELGFM
jgi:FeS assembly SUF system protein